MIENSPIMIDGIDVTTCEGFKYDGIKNPICLAGGIRGIYRSCLCKDNQNCHFKRLTRKTQECEQAEQKLEQIKNICHRKADGLWSQTNPLKEILQIIGEVE